MPLTIESHRACGGACCIQRADGGGTGSRKAGVANERPHVARMFLVRSWCVSGRILACFWCEAGETELKPERGAIQEGRDAKPPLARRFAVRRADTYRNARSMHIPRRTAASSTSTPFPAPGSNDARNEGAMQSRSMARRSSRHRTGKENTHLRTGWHYEGVNTYEWLSVFYEWDDPVTWAY